MKINGRLWASIIVVLFIIISTLNLTTLSSMSENDDDLGKLYLSKSQYLLPNPPGAEATNKTELDPGKPTYFSHNIRDRKFNENLIPELDLWLDAHSQAGIELQFEIGFQAWEDNTLMDGKFYKIKFNNYKTTGAEGGENAKVTFLEYDGEPFNIKYGNDNWASIYLMINISKNATKTSVDILCGAGGRTSFIRLPWDQTLSQYESDKNQDDDDNGSLCMFSLIFVLIIMVVVPGRMVIRHNSKSHGIKKRKKH
ncbi:MAG: hypothetical protein KAJ51_12075, partial [Thermoplasmata archaeon]|nr:hypothetical protein [Thermoplasmata archaeon]